jgi:hypothetical protein
MKKYLLALTAVITGLNISAQTNAEKNRLETLKLFYSASTAEEREKFMAENYHFYFNEKKGNGGSKQSSLKSFMNWDGPLHPDIRIDSVAGNDSIWVVRFLEQNDFSKLIAYPGWKATERVTFDENNRIKEIIYIPEPNQPEYGSYFKPALEWLKKNKPEELNEVYKDKKLVQTERAAKKWVELLKIWRKATNQE